MRISEEARFVLWIAVGQVCAGIAASMFIPLPIAAVPLVLGCVSGALGSWMAYMDLTGRGAV